MKTLLVILVFCLSTPVMAERDIFLCRPGKAPLMGLEHESGIVEIYDKGKLVYEGQSDGHQTILIPVGPRTDGDEKSKGFLLPDNFDGNLWIDR